MNNLANKNREKLHNTNAILAIQSHFSHKVIFSSEIDKARHFLSIEFVICSFSTFLFVAAMRLVTKVCVTFSLSLVSSLTSRDNIPDGPQGPSGAILKVKSNKRKH